MTANYNGALAQALQAAVTATADLGDVLTSFDDFLVATADDRPIVPFQVPEWQNKTVLLRALSSRDRDRWQLRLTSDDYALLSPEEQRAQPKHRMAEFVGWAAALVAQTIVTPSGDRLFSDDQAAVLEQRNAAAIDRIYVKAQELNGFTATDMAKLEDLRTDAKNSSAADGDAPPSVLPGS